MSLFELKTGDVIYLKDKEGYKNKNTGKNYDIRKT